MRILLCLEHKCVMESLNVDVFMMDTRKIPRHLKRIVSYVLMAWLFVIESIKGCPSNLCSCRVQNVVCKGIRLEHVPYFADEEAHLTYEQLDLSRNDIYSIPPYAFKNIRVKAIDIGNNELIGISPRAFAGMHDSLRKLSLNQAGLKVLHWGVFNNLHSLRDLDLTKNELFALPRGLFDSLIDLENLKISWNQIEEIRYGTFRYLKKLSKLNLMGNKIAYIEDKAFEDLRHLSILNLSSNRLSSLHRTMFEGLQNLQRLDLENNMISIIIDQTFLMLPQVKYLSVARNNLTVITTQTFLGLTILEELMLQGNAVFNVSANAFLPTPKLQILQLGDNKMQAFGDECRVGGLDGLKEMWLQNNPVHCDCRWRWIQSFVHSGVLITGRCSQPAGWAGEDLSRMDFSACHNSSCLVLAPTID